MHAKRFEFEFPKNELKSGCGHAYNHGGGSVFVCVAG